jgi:signal transduction histidine kinase
MIAEDAVGCRIDETLAPSILKWVFQQAQERKQFLAEQQHLRRQLDEAAYKIEMADVASTVLHNVGNVLTSVTVAANMVESVIDQSSVILVSRMGELIKAHDQDLGTYLTEDPKGKRIPPSLEKLGTHLIEEQGAILKEMRGLLRNICHMKQIIASHQTMAKSTGQAEQISLTEVLSHAMELSFQPGDEKWITIRLDYQQVPPVLVEQHQLLQILVNLLRNAKQAMRQQVQDRHDLHLSVKYQEDDETYVVMTIQDSGIGIAPEHLSNMFTRGFTTKIDGNGIGLQSSILAIQNMGGSMFVQSEGVGKGATFTLTFPVQKEVVSS